MKKIITFTVAAVVVLGGVVAINHSNAEEKKATITVEDAKKAALTEVDGIVEEIELERHNGQSYYDVEVDKDNRDYDIKVDAQTAKVIQMDERVDDDHDDDRDDVASKEVQKAIITEKEAIEIAQTKIKGDLIEIELDEDDGGYEYEMEFKTSKGEADITIDAETKEVIELEYDDDDRYDD
ncbi:PepSY domain-containing protein [Metabacillus malikii]|uniref:Membrane protein YkoI n=1 Tax=Metabacillus malikii TaxID=1504265 RepID=A0ABT9ZHX4_9BACI|nr:PepSY domain-containing protein [Metabacillus malikii]MDQ0231411.1 putative membrane protein YkoI [Metabacillus malikii]